MISILIDPWLADLVSAATNAEKFAKADALKQICTDFKEKYPIEVLRFIDQQTYSRFREELSKYKGADKQVLLKFINHLELRNEPENEPIQVTGFPLLKDLPECWVNMLATIGTSDEPPAWRSPMIFVPEVRRNKWPSDNEITYILDGKQKERNLVTIELYSEHPHFEADIDPWRLKCVGVPKPDAPCHERSVTCMRLPRPPQLPLNLPLSHLTAELKKIPNWSCNTTTDYYYLPKEGWEATHFDRDKWRNISFPRGVVQKKGRKKESGYLDNNGYIWVWDKEEENHWDVKTSDDIRIAKVCYTGRIKKHG